MFHVKHGESHLHGTLDILAAACRTAPTGWNGYPSAPLAYPEPSSFGRILPGLTRIPPLRAGIAARWRAISPESLRVGSPARNNRGVASSDRRISRAASMFNRFRSPPPDIDDLPIGDLPEDDDFLVDPRTGGYLPDQDHPEPEPSPKQDFPIQSGAASHSHTLYRPPQQIPRPDSLSHKGLPELPQPVAAPPTAGAAPPLDRVSSDSHPGFSTSMGPTWQAGTETVNVPPGGDQLTELGPRGDLTDHHDSDDGEEVLTQSGHPAAKLALPRTLAIANQKGGVGKTTTAVNLGAALAELDYRVLVVDLDPQGNATTGLGINARNLESSVYDVILHDVPIEDVIEPTTLRNLFVVPATIDLAGAEIELVPVFSRELRLRRALEAVENEFDFVLIDCPPSLGLLTVNGLAAAGEVVVPIQCEYYALEGLGQLLRNVSLVQSNLNSRLEVSTIVLTMYDARTRLAEQVVADVRQHFGEKVCRNVVPRTVRLSEAPSFGQPIIVFDPSSRGSIAYRELAKEVSGGPSQRTR